MRVIVKRASLALAAACVIGAVGSASAVAALPEFAYSKGFTGSSGQTTFHGWGATWSYINGGKTSASAETKTTFKNVSLSFAGAGFEKGCENVESNTGISFENLTAHLGYINKAKKEVGLMFEPAKQPLAQCTFFVGGGKSTKTYSGHVIAHITPVNTPTNKYTLAFEVVPLESEVQAPQFFEGEAESLSSFPLTLGEYHCTEKGCSHTGRRVGIQTGSMEITFSTLNELIA